MNYGSAIVTVAAAIIIASPGPTRADEIVAADGYLCSEGPVLNLYRGAYYGAQLPAVYRGYAYRPFYRYTAYRAFPRAYDCTPYRHRWHRW
jgi:hypothetical protein